MSADKHPAPAKLRLPHTDPHEPVHPARPDDNHLAIVVMTLAVMLAASLVATFLVIFETVTWHAAWILGTIICTGFVVLTLAELWFRRSRR